MFYRKTLTPISSSARDDMGTIVKKITGRATSLEEDVAMFYRKTLKSISSSARDDMGTIVKKPPAEQRLSKRLPCVNIYEMLLAVPIGTHYG
jgi:putative transposon-encoded protein